MSRASGASLNFGSKLGIGRGRHVKGERTRGRGRSAPSLITERRLLVASAVLDWWGRPGAGMGRAVKRRRRDPVWWFGGLVWGFLEDEANGIRPGR